MSHKLVLVRNISGGIFSLPDKSPSITDMGDLVMSEGTKIIGNPGTKGDTGAQGATGTKGEIRVTATHIYVCTATNTWVRSALATW